MSASLPENDPAKYLSPEWDAAIERMWHLEGLKHGFRHEWAKEFSMASFCLLETTTSAEVDGFAAAEYWSRFPFAEWGERFFLAWIREDVAFFEDLARVGRTLAGKHKLPKDDPGYLEAKVIRAALDLAYRIKRDPSRKEVESECERLGIHPSWKDLWKARRKFCLGFLKARGRGER